MSKNLLLVYLFIFFITKAQAFSVNGVVENGAHHLPVAGAHVFINNTQKFCITDSAGNFTIEHVDFDYFDLIVAAKGFQSISYRFMKEMIDKKIHFQLDSLTPDSSISLFHSYNASHDKERLKTFFNRFIGDTLNNKYNYILNPEVLKFSFDSNKNILHLKTTDRLLFLNEELGYMLNMYIDELAIGKDDEYFLGYMYFKPLKFRNDESFEQCKKNRRNTYRMSLVHFISALYQNKPAKEGFEINRVTRAFEGSDEYKKYAIKNNAAIYQNPAISPKKFIYIIDRKHPVPVEEFLHKDERNGAVFIHSNTVSILHVLYMNSLLQPSSLLFLPADKKIRIEQNGMLFEPEDIAVDGYWHLIKIKNLLPFDYVEE